MDIWWLQKEIGYQVPDFVSYSPQMFLTFDAEIIKRV